MEQLLAHLAGDYLLQNSWMATEKHKRFGVASVHGFVYTLPFTLITTEIAALLIIGLSHAVIDYLGLIERYIWAKDQLAPKRYRTTWQDFKKHHAHIDDWMFFFLRVVADNAIHLIINFYAISELG